MSDVTAEIARVKEAIQKTTSPHLRRDYMKHLRKLERMQNERRRCHGVESAKPQESGRPST
jgi:hypothetical protein